MKMLKKYRSILIIAVLLLVFLLSITYQMNGSEKENEQRKRISFIVYGDDSERWENIRQGAGLVCDEYGADVSLITMMSDDDAEEQKQIIEREAADGADAVIIAACNSAAIRDYVESGAVKVPVVFIESVSDLGAGYKSIAPDDYKMGYDLGCEVAESEKDIATIAIISDNTNRDNAILREKGFRDAIKGRFAKVINWTRDYNTKRSNTRTFIQKAIVSEATDVIVTFDNTTTDALLDALTNLNKKSKVYSISTSDKAVYSLNKKDIKALMYTDEFSMGYLAAMYAVDNKNAIKKYSHRVIDYRIVRKEDMYDEGNQTLLFPFVN